MLLYVLRRLGHGLITVASVMVLAFLLFNLVAGDVSAGFVPRHMGEQGREDWRAKHGLNKPTWFDTSARPWEGAFWDSQFWNHMKGTVGFTAHSYRPEYEHMTLLDIIRQRAHKSLALTVPIMALGWFSALVVSSVVAYYRGTVVDRVGVFLSVLGMCIPFLAYMILGQWLMFQISPEHAWGLAHPVNIYVPIAIGVIAGIGANVRFYRTVLLDEMNRDYVRTARAKGVPLPNILFKHVLRNCMLPILTSLVLSIPFLILGSLLLEQFFGVNGLGDLMLSSINDRDVPIVTGLTYLTAVIYVIGLLVRDILYPVFDPRIKLS